MSEKVLVKKCESFIMNYSTTYLKFIKVEKQYLQIYSCYSNFKSTKLKNIVIYLFKFRNA